MLLRIADGEMQAAKAARIVEAQQPAAIQHQVPMIVSLQWRARLHQPQAARHAEMQYQRAGVEGDENVLGAPFDAAHCLPDDVFLEVRRYGPAQSSLAHN